MARSGGSRGGKRTVAARPSRGTDPVARLRALCLALPEANEKLSHGEPTWFAGKGKVFAMLDNHHHGAEHLSVWLPAGLDMAGSVVLAAGRFDFIHKIEYSDYREANVSTTFRPGSAR